MNLSSPCWCVYVTTSQTSYLLTCVMLLVFCLMSLVLCFGFLVSSAFPSVISPLCSPLFPPFLSVSVVSFMPPLYLPLVISPVLLPPLASPVPRLVFTVCVFSFFRLFIGSLFVAFPCLLMFLDVPRVSLYSACRLLVWI